MDRLTLILVAAGTAFFMFTLGWVVCRLWMHMYSKNSEPIDSATASHYVDPEQDPQLAIENLNELEAEFAREHHIGRSDLGKAQNEQL